jgi:hypothetical protein
LCHAPEPLPTFENSLGKRFATLGHDPCEAKSGYREEHYIWGAGAQQPLPIASNP